MKTVPTYRDTETFFDLITLLRLEWYTQRVKLSILVKLRYVILFALYFTFSPSLRLVLKVFRASEYAVSVYIIVPRP